MEDVWPGQVNSPVCTGYKRVKLASQVHSAQFMRSVGPLPADLAGEAQIKLVKSRAQVLALAQ